MYVNHTSLETIRDQFPDKRFSVKKVRKPDISRKDIIKLNSSLVSLDSDISIKVIMKQNIDIFVIETKEVLVETKRFARFCNRILYFRI